MSESDFPLFDELVQEVEEYFSSPPPTTSGQKDQEVYMKARIGKPKEGKIIDRLSHEDGRTAKIVYDLDGNIQSIEGDEELLDHFEPGEGMEEYLREKREHFNEVQDS